jgi:hypothetical protein
MSTTQLRSLRGPPAATPGKLIHAIARTHPVGQVAAATRHLLDGKAGGKLAVSVSPGRRQTPGTGSTP